jgi:hypothetical protein
LSIIVIKTRNKKILPLPREGCLTHGKFCFSALSRSHYQGIFQGKFFFQEARLLGVRRSKEIRNNMPENLQKKPNLRHWMNHVMPVIFITRLQVTQQLIRRIAIIVVIVIIYYPQIICCGSPH